MRRQPLHRELVQAHGSRAAQPRAEAGLLDGAAVSSYEDRFFLHAASSVPAPVAVPAAAQHNKENNNYEKEGGIHV